MTVKSIESDENEWKPRLSTEERFALEYVANCRRRNSLPSVRDANAWLLVNQRRISTELECDAILGLSGQFDDKVFVSTVMDFWKSTFHKGIEELNYKS